MYYIYVKTHKTGLKYLGHTTSKNPHTYAGSGKYWKLHLKKHGKEYTTEILKECSTKEETKYWGEHYSKLWNVVASPEWANLKEESGEGGWPKDAHLGKSHSAESKDKMSKARKGVPNPKNSIPKTVDQKEHLRKINLGKIISDEVKLKIKQTKLKNPFSHTEETKEKMRVPKSAATVDNMKKAQRQRRQETSVMWITDGVNDTIIECNITIPHGWKPGRTQGCTPPSQQGKKWANNGVVSKMVYEIPEGWQHGRLYIRKEK